MLRQVSPPPGAPAAPSAYPRGSQWVWYRPVMGASSSGHSFAPPWLELFLSSLWFPSQCRCPAASWERPGEEASCCPGVAVPEKGELCRATEGGREEGEPPSGCSTPGLPVLARTPPPSLSLFDPGCPAQACRERASWVTPCAGPLCLQTVTVAAIPAQLAAAPLPHTSTNPGAVLGTTQTRTIRWDLQGSWGIKWSYSFLSYPLPCSPPPQHAPTPHTASKVKPMPGHRPPAPALLQDTQAAPAGRAGRMGGQKPGEDNLASRESSTTTHTHTHANSGANLQSRNASPCQELSYFPLSSRLAALS